MPSFCWGSAAGGRSPLNKNVEAAWDQKTTPNMRVAQDLQKNSFSSEKKQNHKKKLNICQIQGATPSCRRPPEERRHDATRLRGHEAIALVTCASSPGSSEGEQRRRGRMRKRAPGIDEKQANRSKRAPRKSSNMSPRGAQNEANLSLK